MDLVHTFYKNESLKVICIERKKMSLWHANTAPDCA